MPSDQFQLTKRRGRSVLWAFTAAAMVAAVGTLTAAQSLPTLTVSGRHLVDPTGQVVKLRGCNLGNWLLLEPWMLGLRQEDTPGGYPDQATVLRQLEQRFGDAATDELIETYRAHFLLPRDMQAIASFGFNVVRLPIHYSVLEDDGDPERLKTDAFKWIDRAVEMADDAGLYVILDLHGVPGGQSVDGPTGEIEQNRLWTDPQCQRRTVWLWQQLAQRYADTPTVAAYDVVNEPFGDFQTDISPDMRELFGRLHDAIREIDPDTLIYAPGTLQGIAHYGDPADHGWRNVGFTEHAYPGLFGWGETSLRGHARFLAQWVAGRDRRLQRLDVPYLIGEFNVVFDHVGGPALMDHYFDVYREAGWAATMWAYKILKPEPGVGTSNWYMVTNAQPFVLDDLDSVSFDELKKRFESLGTMPLAIDDELRSALTRTAASPPLLPQIETVFDATDQPLVGPLEGWDATDIGDAAEGGQRLDGDRLRIWGGGEDIFNRRDAFRFVHRAAGDDARLWTRLDALDPTDRYAKAGVMLRGGTAPDAAHVLIHALPDGRVVAAWRDEAGGLTREQTLGLPGFPVGLGLQRAGDQVVLHYTDARGRWQQHTRPIPGFDGGQIGLAVLAHDAAALTAADFSPPTDQHPADETATQPESEPEQNLLQNGSFEAVKDPRDAADQAAGWNRWGHWLNRHDDWIPVRDGGAILAYHHWQIEAADTSGVWQDVSGLTPGHRYRFTVFANRDPGDGNGVAPASVEVRLETPGPDATMLTLATTTYRAADLPTGQQWGKLTLEAHATAPRMRVLLMVNPAGETPRDGALKFDDARLVVSPDP